MSAPVSGEALQGGSPFERRVSPRVAARLGVELLLSGLPGPLAGRSCELGPGGVCVETETPFALGSLYRVALLVDGERLELEAVGRWQRDEADRSSLRTGVQFVDPEQEVARRLWRFVRERADELASFLHESPDFQGLDVSDATDLALFTRMEELSPGQYVYRGGPDAPVAGSLYVVYEGAVVLEGRSRLGQVVFLERLARGALFGGMAMLAELPQAESAVAEEKSLLLEVDRYTFAYLHGAKPHAARVLSRAIARKHALTVAALIERLADRDEE